MKTILTVKDVHCAIRTIINAVEFVDKNPEVLGGVTFPFHQGSESLYKIKVYKPQKNNPFVIPLGICSKVEVFRVDLKTPLEETLVFEMSVSDLSVGSYAYHSLVLGLIKAVISQDVPMEDISGCVFERVNETLVLQVKRLETGTVVYSHSVLAGLPISDAVKLEAMSLALHINPENEEVPFTHEGRLKALQSGLFHHQV